MPLAKHLGFIVSVDVSSPRNCSFLRRPNNLLVSASSPQMQTNRLQSPHGCCDHQFPATGDSILRYQACNEDGNVVGQDSDQGFDFQFKIVTEDDVRFSAAHCRWHCVTNRETMPAPARVFAHTVSSHTRAQVLGTDVSTDRVCS